MSGPSESAKARVWETVRQINQAWIEGHPERLAHLFHENIVNVGGDGRRYAEGREACIEGYRSFCDSVVIAGFPELEPQIDIYGTTAVASYRFEIEYTMDGKTLKESGCDTFVLESHDGGWLAVWRQLLAQPAP
jgi:hypothetical protein